MTAGALVPLLATAMVAVACLGHPAAIWGGLVFLTLGTAIFDHLSRTAPGRASPAPDGLLVCLGLAHVALIALGMHALAGPEHVDGARRVALFALLGLYFGQVSMSTAHELIHRGETGLNWLGRLVYISLLFGHHASAHPAVHHRYVATPRDPNTPRPGESVYAFIPRAWLGSFRAGLAVERGRLRRAGRSPMSIANPYWAYVLGGLGMLLAVGLLSSGAAVAWYVGLCSYATCQLLVTDYVQHYGLRRRKIGATRYEPVGPEHSWNAPHRFSGALMLNAPDHSQHHTIPVPAGDWGSGTAVPTLPYSLPVMVTLAFFPSVFRRAMAAPLARWTPSQPTEPLARTDTAPA